MSKEFIRIGGAREHNLKNLTLNIPRDKLVVITGLSGRGKSSLAFDTIYAEGQRKYVESLSAYARQFLDQMQKPDVDFIEGLSPAIAIEQRSGQQPALDHRHHHGNLRLPPPALRPRRSPALPGHRRPHRPQTTSDIVDKILALLPEPGDAARAGCAPAERRVPRRDRAAVPRGLRARPGGRRDWWNSAAGVARFQLNPKKKFHNIEAVVDRLVIDGKIRVRLSDSVETALEVGRGRDAYPAPKADESKAQSPKSKAVES